MNNLASALVLAIVLAGSSNSHAATPANRLSWRQQVEADWRLQEAKRQAPPVPNQSVSPPEDAAGGVDGVKSTSQWSARSPAVSRPALQYPTSSIIQRGLKLAASQRQLGAPVDPGEAVLRQLAEEIKSLPVPTAPDPQRELYLRARETVRQMALANPLLHFDDLLFVKRAPGMFPHMSDQHYGWWSRPGGGVFLLKDFKSQISSLKSNTPPPTPVCLTADMLLGSFIGPDLSYDGKKVLFAYCRYHPEVANMEKVDKNKLPADAFYHLYEMNVDGTGRRQLTQGRYDDFDARFLPSGEILFLSTRKGLAIQSSQQFSDSTRTADLPDSYVRCGGDSHRPVPVFTLHVMDAQGRNLRPLSAFENFEWTPSVAQDGRVLYTRWDYIDRFNGHFFSLWSANQDGAHPQLVYGNYTVKPQVVLEARSIPGSSKLVFTACAHHSITGGSLCLLDRTLGTEDEAPLTRLTPEVCFPETEGWPEHYYANPWPLSEDYFLVAWSTAKLPPHSRVENEQNPIHAMGLYLYDAFGNLELLYRDPELSSMHPLPVAPRPRPPVLTPVADWQGAPHGRLLVQDLYQGLEGVSRGTIKRLRLVGVPPKVQPYMNNPVLGVSAEDPGKFVLGTVPVEEDGSAFFPIPSGVPVFFQALDQQGLAVQTMRSLTYVMPNQTLACIGCHEHRDTAPPLSPFPLAARREPSKITPAPEGAWPLRFSELVQPVLDRYCVSCHRADSGLMAARAIDLTGDKAYQALLAFANDDLKKAAFERDRSLAGRGVCATSKLWPLLVENPGHQGVQLDDDSQDRLATWMDTYAQRLGSFSAEQEKQLAALRVLLRPILAEPSASR